MAGAFKANEAGFRAMAIGPEIRAALAQVAEKGKQIAEGLSEDFKITGTYKDSFEVAEVTEADYAHRGPRATARLVNTAPHAAAVEWGYEGRAGEPSSSAHRVLGRSGDLLGGQS